MIYDIIKQSQKSNLTKPFMSTASTSSAVPSAVSMNKPSISIHQNTNKPRTDLPKDPLTMERVINEPQANLQENFSVSAQVTDDTSIDDPDLAVN